MDQIVLMEARRQGVGIVLTADTDAPGKLVRWGSQLFAVVDLAATAAEQRCTVMHELGHNALGHPIPETEAEYEAMEDAADRWAAEKLISDDALADALDRARDMREVEEILMVDPKTLAARMGATVHRTALILVPQVG